MSAFQVDPPIKDSNHFNDGKWKTWVILLAVVYFPVQAGQEKKHRRELPVPGKEKEVSGPSSSFDPTEKTTQRPTTLRSTEAGASGPLKNNALPGAPRKAGRPASSVSEDTSCTEKYPIETFMQIASANSPQASKRGGVYFISDLRETPQVYLLETPGAWPEQMTFFPDGVAYFQVSPDGLKMLVATDEGGDEQYDIYLLHLKSKKLSPLITGRKKRIESVRWDSKSNWFAYTSTERNLKDLDLYRFDTGTQKSTLLSNVEGNYTVSDISSEGNLIALVAFRSIADADVLIFNQKEKKLENITKNTKFRASSPHFSANADTLFFLSDHEGDMSQLFEINLKDRSGIRPLTSDRWGVESIHLSKDRDALFYSLNEDGYSKIRGFEIDKKGKRKRPLSLPDTTGSVVGGYSSADTYGKGALFYTVSNSKQTSDVWLWKRGSSIQWTHSTHGPTRPSCFLREKLIRYPSFDKTEIPAFVFLPKGVSFDSPSQVPFIVYIHGGPESQYRPSFSKTFQYFLQRGFGVFAPNIRGSTGYGRNYTSLDDYKKRMDSIQDIIEGTRWLLKNQFTRSKILSLYGGSYGGFAVLRTLEVEPTLFAAASESVGISNFVTFLQNTKPYRRALREAEYGPLSDTEFLKSISPINYVDLIKTPLLIFHGANDPRVPLNETEQIVEALKKRDIPVDFTIFKDEGHGNKKLSNITTQARQMAFFFEKYAAEEEKK